MQPVQSATAFEAFHKAQTEFKSAIKDGKNPHFKSKFAPLESVYEAVSSALHSNGLFVTQPIKILESGTVVETVVRYKDGTVIEQSQCPVICKVQNDPQAMGSAITYARRYSLASTLCIVTDDDDAEAANAPAPVAEKKVEEQLSTNKAIEKVISTCQNLQELNQTKLTILTNSNNLSDDEAKALKVLLVKRANQLGFTYDPNATKFK